MSLFRIALSTAIIFPAALRGQPHSDMERREQTVESISIETILNEVRINNLELRAARARAEAKKERLPQAAAWDDPRFGVDIERSNRRLLSYNDAEWMVSQSIPVNGKVAQRKEAASAEIATANAALHQIELDLEMRARTAYYRLANAEAQLAINTRNQSVMRQIVEVTRAKYESGRLRQADAFLAETELVKMEEARVDLMRAYSEAQTALNTLMNHAPQAALGHASLPDFAPAKATLETMQNMALAHRPQLAAADSRIAAAKARVALAERDRYPDPEFRIEARQFNGSALYNLHEYDTGIFISLPWANGAKYRAAIREAKRIAEAEQHDRKAIETETVGMVRDTWQRVQTSQHHVELFRDRLLPLARQTIDATRSSYEADRATLLELLNAQHTAQDVESMLNDHLTDYFVAQAEFIPLTGESVPAPVQP
jgi:outer membrane protein TolC